MRSKSIILLVACLAGATGCGVMGPPVAYVDAAESKELPQQELEKAATAPVEPEAAYPEREQLGE